jgi:hypothetical protein
VDGVDCSDYVVGGVVETLDRNELEQLDTNCNSCCLEGIQEVG